MIAYFPAIYPDELMYSWFCRYYAHSGFFSSKSAMQELYCKRSDNPSKEFIGNLNSEELYCKRSDNPSKEFIGNLNPEAKVRIGNLYSLRELVLDHTMYLLL